jgi:hypothetical protein
MAEPIRICIDIRDGLLRGVQVTAPLSDVRTVAEHAVSLARSLEHAPYRPESAILAKIGRMREAAQRTPPPNRSAHAAKETGG